MSENIISLKEEAQKRQNGAPLETPAAGHLAASAVLIERIRQNADIALLGMNNCPDRVADIRVHLRNIRELIESADTAFDTYAEILACEGRA